MHVLTSVARSGGSPRSSRWLSSGKDSGVTPSRRNKEALRAIADKGLGYGALKQAGLLSEPPPIAVRFNYLGQFDTEDGWWQVTGERSGQSIAQANGSHAQTRSRSTSMGPRLMDNYAYRSRLI